MAQGIKCGKSEPTRDQELGFLATVREYEDAFAISGSDLGLEHEIGMEDHKPIKQHPRTLPPHQRPRVEKQTESLLSHQIALGAESAMAAFVWVLIIEN